MTFSNFFRDFLEISWHHFLKTLLDKMLYLDATELLENPGMSLRRVANFAGVPPLINENNFFFDEEKGKNYVTARTIT